MVAAITATEIRALQAAAYLAALRAELEELQHQHFGNQCSDNFYSTSGRWRRMEHRIAAVKEGIAALGGGPTAICVACNGSGHAPIQPYPDIRVVCSVCAGSGKT